MTSATSLGRLVLGVAVLARLEIGGERLAATFQRLRDIHRKGFGIEFFRGLGFDVTVTHVGDTIA